MKGSIQLLGVMAVVLVLRLLVSDAYRAATAPGGLYAIDFRAYYAAADDLRHGRPLYADVYSADRLYAGKRYVYPPLLAIALRPLAAYPFDRAFRMWVAVNSGLLVGSVLLFASARRHARVCSLLVIILFVVMAFRYWPTSVELAIGQADVILLFLVCGIYMAESIDWLPATCLLIIAAALIKPWTLSLLYVVVARRAWVAAGATVLGYTAAMVGLFAVVGGGQFHSYLQTLRSFAYQPMLVSHSVQGIAKLLFSAHSEVQPIRASHLLYAAVLFAGYSLLVIGLYIDWRRSPRLRSAGRRTLSLDVAVVATLLGLSVCHMWYYILILPLLWRLVADGLGGEGNLWKGAVGVGVYLVLASTFPGVSPIPEASRHGWQIARVMTPFLAGAVLWATLLAEVAEGGGSRTEEAAVPETVGIVG